MYHVISTVSEWICAAAFDIFMLTLVPEFKSISMERPQVIVTVESFTAYNGSGQYNSVESIVSEVRGAVGYGESVSSSSPALGSIVPLSPDPVLT